MLYRWWEELGEARAEAEPMVGANTTIAEDAIIRGDVVIGDNCMIGNGVIIRGHVRIGNGVRLGYGVEIKNAIIRDNTWIGPLCYVGDSVIEEEVYLGALVRTSNHRLDRANIKSWNGVELEDTHREKLGCWIRTKTSLGVGVVILPGRIVPEDSVFSPHIVITRNYPVGVYQLVQNISRIG